MTDAGIDYPIIGEVGARSLADAHLTRNAGGFLRRLWRLAPHEASARVREAAALAARAAVSGEVLGRSGVLSGSSGPSPTRSEQSV